MDLAALGDMTEHIQLLLVFFAHEFLLAGCCGNKSVFWYSAAMPSMAPSDAPTALVMGAGFLTFGLTMILRPGYVRANLDRFADRLGRSALMMPEVSDEKTGATAWIVRAEHG